jgi:hypothetical protein
MSKDISKVQAGGAKKGSDFNAAVSGAEAIRKWDDHRIGVAALAAKFETNKDSGLTESQA